MNGRPPSVRAPSSFATLMQSTINRFLGLGPAPGVVSRLPPTTLRNSKRTLLSLWLVAGCTLAPAIANAANGESPKVFTKDVRHSALTAPPGTLEFGVFSYARYTANERLELALHPLGFLLWPQLEAKLRWWDTEAFTLSSLHAVSYPTWFMNVVSREGTGGLVDPTANVPAAAQMDVGLLATWRLGPSSWGTLQPFAQGALGGSVPVLEFPFLYPRLAAANAGWVVGINTALEGVIQNAVGYEMAVSYTHLPLPSIEGAFAVEALFEARVLLSAASTLPIGLRFSHARYPYGRRSHWLPYVDYRLVW